MTTRGWTYSAHKPNTSGLARTRDKLFDNFVVNEQAARDRRMGQINAQPPKEPKKKRRSIKESRQTSGDSQDDKRQNDETTVCLFKDESKYKEKKRGSKKTKSSKTDNKYKGMLLKQRIARARSNVVEAKLNEQTPAGVESQESDSDLVIEQPVTRQALTSTKKFTARKYDTTSSCRSNPHELPANVNDNIACLENVSAFQESYTSASQINVSKNYSSDIEKARDFPDFLTHKERPLMRSPMISLVPSDEDSLVTSSKTEQTEASELGWVTISSKQRSSSTHRTGVEATDSATCEGSSHYTYTYISTYTDGTTSGTVSTKTTAASPPVKMKKLQRRLNSTKYQGKDSIGAVKFPDSLSAVWPPQNEVTVQVKQTGSDSATSKAGSHRGRSTKEPKLNKGPPKCSTVLFMSQPPSAIHLESENLTTIHAVSDAQNISLSPLNVKPFLCSQPDVSQSNVSLCGIKQSQRPSWQVMKSSTPEVAFQPMSFSMSPIGPPSFADGELPVHESIDVNSEEIIVPSFVEPSILVVNPKQCVLNEPSDMDEPRHGRSKVTGCESGNARNIDQNTSSPAGRPASPVNNDDVRSEDSQHKTGTNVFVNIKAIPQVEGHGETQGKRSDANLGVSAATDRNHSSKAGQSFQKDRSHQKLSSDTSLNLKQIKVGKENMRSGKLDSSSCQSKLENKTRPKRSVAIEAQDKFTMETISKERHQTKCDEHITNMCDDEYCKVKLCFPCRGFQADKYCPNICFINRICMQSQQNLRQRNRAQHVIDRGE